jgi:choline dehydrogenase
MGLQYLLFRRGLMATNATFCIGYVRTDEHLAAPNVGVAFGAWARAAAGHTKSGLGLHKFSGFTFTTFLLHPDSRGSVRIKSADTAVAPEIRFNFFRSASDHKTMVKAIRSVRRVASMPALTPYIVEELTPGAARQSDEELIAFCRSNGRSTHHAGGTCKMGIGEHAVVDPRLRVRGMSGLRVADASIMPSMIGGNTNAPIVMIAEKGAAMILEDAKAQ